MQWWKSWRRRSEAQPDAAGAVDLLLSAYLDGDLPASERDTVERQLTEDPALRETLDGLREVVAGLQRFEELAAPRVFMVSAEALPRQRGLSRRELGLRVGALAAAIAFVFAIGIDLQRGSTGGVRGQAAPLRLAESSASDSLARSAGGAGASLGAGATSGGETGVAADDAATLPRIVPTAFVVQPTLAAATPNASLPRREQGAPATATEAPARTPPVAAGAGSTMTSALQGTPATGLGAASTSTPGVTPTVTRTATPTVTPPPDTKREATPVSGSVGASGIAAPPIAPLAPTPASAEERSVAPVAPVAPAAPVTGGPAKGSASSSDSAAGRGLVAPVAGDKGVGWGQDTMRVSVVREDRLDALRVSELGLGTLALGLGSLTGWLWYARRRGAAMSGS